MCIVYTCVYVCAMSVYVHEYMNVYICNSCIGHEYASECVCVHCVHVRVCICNIHEYSTCMCVWNMLIDVPVSRIGMHSSIDGRSENIWDKELDESFI